MSYRIRGHLVTYTPWGRAGQHAQVCTYTDYRCEYLAVEGPEDIVPRIVSDRNPKRRGSRRALQSEMDAMEAGLKGKGWTPAGSMQRAAYQGLMHGEEAAASQPSSEIFSGSRQIELGITAQLGAYCRPMLYQVRQNGMCVAEVVENAMVVDGELTTHVTAYRAPGGEWRVAYASGGAEHNMWLLDFRARIRARGFEYDFKITK